MLRIERAAPTDAPDFARLEADPDTRAFVISYTEDQHRQYLLDRSMIYLRIVDSALVGFFLLVLGDGPSVEFRRIVIEPKGQGIGQRAIALMEEYCRADLKCSRIWLDVFDDNHRGRHVYENLGYTRFGERNHDGRRLLLYEKSLNSA